MVRRGSSGRYMHKGPTDLRSSSMAWTLRGRGRALVLQSFYHTSLHPCICRYSHCLQLDYSSYKEGWGKIPHNSNDFSPEEGGAKLNNISCVGERITIGEQGREILRTAVYVLIAD